MAKVRKLVGTKRVGHAGTLDPAATGVLPICIGAATRIAEYLSDAGKAYRASIALGLATPSYDLETPPTITLPQNWEELSYIPAMRLGEPLNTPPLNHGGQPTILPLKQGEQPTIPPMTQGGQPTILPLREGEQPTIPPLTQGWQGGVADLARLAALTIPELEAVLQAFVGPQLQTPPMYSALHVGGQRLYDLARAGQEVERVARPITIYSLKLLSFAPLLIGDIEYPTLEVEVECSKGTYIRSLAVDIGAKLGAPAVLAALVRTRSGPFRLEDAHTLDRLTEAAQSGRLAELLYPTDYALADLPRVDLSADDVLHIRMGQTIAAAASTDDGTLARAYSTDGNFIAILRLQAQRWQPNKVFNLDLVLRPQLVGKIA